MTLRRTLCFGSAAVAASLLAACAGGATESPDDGAGGTTGSGDAGSATVSFRSWSPIEQTTAQMVATFEEANPGTQIDTTIFNYPEYIVDLQTRASSGTMPDIVGLQPGALTQQYRDHLMPLQQCAEDAWGPDWQDMFYPIGLDQARMGNPEGDENFYALPILVQTVNLWANTQILEDHGVEPPRTWDELVAAVDTMSGNEFAPFLLPAKDSWLRNVVFLQIANNVAPGLVYEAEEGAASWTDDGIVTAFEYWGRLFSDGIAQDGALALDAYPNGANQFESGTAAMIPLGAWWIQQSDPSRSEVPPLSEGMAGFEPFLFPTIPGGAQESQFVGGIDVALGIAADSENPELACQVLTDWIAGDGAQDLINTFNDLPAVTGLNPEEFTSDRQQRIWSTFTEDWMPQVQYSRYLQSPEMDSALADALAAVAAGDSTPAEAAAAVQEVQDSVNS
ncbi:extracellular solute-binding protein [Ruania alkalisoli]|uniref:Extracellular solute-binding protein n=1 Tax=Ruania alkalisoli TaxID=2779775 RepID=A0A7M1SUA0_9MICO|nr:extracellular solute-binding protein [Ruania alkalisoli]QOR71160.1 extracellular solute-binding protein [Ruania alkalisoli]